MSNRKTVPLLLFCAFLHATAVGQPCQPPPPRTPLDSASHQLVDSLSTQYSGDFLYYSCHVIARKSDYAELLYQSGKRLMRVQFSLRPNGSLRRDQRRIRRSEALSYFYNARLDTVTTNPQSEIVATHSPRHYVYVRRQGTGSCITLFDYELSDEDHPRARLVFLLKEGRVR